MDSREERIRLQREIRKHCICLHKLHDKLILLEERNSDEKDLVPSRYSLRKIRDVGSWASYRKQLDAFWTSDEIDLRNDYVDYNKLSKEERTVLDACLAFLSRADIMMIDTLMTCLYYLSKTPEEKMFYSIQACIEGIHSEAYSQFIKTIAPLEMDRKRIFDVADSLESGKKKSAWMKKYMTEECDVATLVLVYICVEGIFFLAPFQVQFWFQSRKLLPGIMFGNELISRDENIHKERGETKYRSLKMHERLSVEDAHRIVSEAVNMEIEFTKEILPAPIKDLKPEDIIAYIEILGDSILTNCNYPPKYNRDKSDIPPYMKNGSLAIKTNFYEHKVGAYSQKIKGSENIDPFSDDYHLNIG